MSVRILAPPGSEQALTSSSLEQPRAPRVEEILRAACRVVVEEGAHALRIGTVAREVGVSRPLVHYYFATRRELLRATFAFAEDRRIEALEKELAGLASGRERAERALMRTIEPVVEENPALWNEVWSSLGEDAELGPLLRERYRAWANRIVRLLDEGRGDGSVPPGVDPTESGLRLAAAADGLDSMLYLGIVDRETSRRLLASSLERELAT